MNKLVRDVGVIRATKEANRLATHRRMASGKIAKLDIKRLAERWIGGTEVEELADELHVPADLLRDALAEQLSTRGGVTRKSRLTCAAACSYGCTERCAITAPVNDRAKVPGTPRSSSGRQGQGEGVPYVRTGLNLPDRGQYTPQPRFE